MFRSLYLRMSIVHYLGIFLLLISGIFLTNNLYAQIVQIVVAIVIVIHELDENTNGRKLSATIANKLRNIDKDYNINVKYASEYDIFLEIIDKYKSDNDNKLVDRELVKDAEEVILKITNGLYSNKIQKSTNNPELNKLKELINIMILQTSNHISDINIILKEYSNFNYTNQLNIENIADGGILKDLILNINTLRDSTIDMFIGNKKNGIILESSSNDLFVNIDHLDNTSKEAAKSLDQTSESLNIMTSNITDNTSTIKKMSSYGEDLQVSVDSGQKLASQTTQSMDEINNQVSSINNAISVIDQISFQTNILSLNAAVEAATAGEAGKGFAVVAQEVRNLASRSASAANEIKLLVENATQKANSGKVISDEMIDGYTHINSNIIKTIQMIKDVESLSKEQQNNIEHINEIVIQLNKQTNTNLEITEKTKVIAEQTQAISQNIVKDSNEKKY